MLRSFMDYRESCAAGDDEDVEKAWETEEEENADIEVENADIRVQFSEAQHPKPKGKGKAKGKLISKKKIEEENAEIEVEIADIIVPYSEAQHPKPKGKAKGKGKLISNRSIEEENADIRVQYSEAQHPKPKGKGKAKGKLISKKKIEEENADTEVENADMRVQYSEAQHPKPKGKGKGKLISNRNITATKVRKSCRARVLVNVKRNDYSWAPQVERSLLEAVKKYGHLDMKRLCEAVPNKSESAIKSMIIKWCQRATAIGQREMDGKSINDKRFMVNWTYIKNYTVKKPNIIYGETSARFLVNRMQTTPETKRRFWTVAMEVYVTTRFFLFRKNRGKKMPPKLAPIKQWLQELHKAGARNVAETNHVAKAMQYISLFEKHPDPAECGGIDFSALYDYLYRILMGYPPKDLNEATNNYLLSVMDSLVKEVRDGDFYEEMFHLSSLGKIFLTPTAVKQYRSSKNKVNANPIDKEVAHMKSLLEIPGFNPLGIPLHLLIKKQ